MSQSHEDIVGLVDTLVTALVDDKEAVSVESEADGEDLRIDITVAEEETGKIIGRKGRVIKSIRTLARAAASQAGFEVEVEVLG
jgi:uncharacterized protein